MNARSRTIILTLCATAAVGSFVAFAVTGAHPYTRFRDKEVEQTNSQTDLSDLFSQSGTTQAPPPKAVESVNAIGLLPSGPGLASISVATIAGPAVAAMGLVWWLGRRSCAGCAAGKCENSPPGAT